MTGAFWAVFCNAVVAIPTDAALRMDISALHEQLQHDRSAGCTPVAVVASAGTVNTGAVDPLPEILTVYHNFSVPASTACEAEPES